MADYIDLFAGPDGWGQGAKRHGIDALGIEFDDAACATRRAVGAQTLQADVSALRPEEFGPVVGMIGSPPCTGFSSAGKGRGRAAIEVYRAAISRWAYEAKPPRSAELDDACDDPSAHLVLEPLRWALALRPRWVALEQVPPVLPVWEALAAALHSLGYSSWTGLLTAEQFGVPQTRRRAFLLASLDREVAAPAPTHQRYVSPRRSRRDAASLFDVEPARVVHPDDAGLQPWVSMGEALGWGHGDLVGFPRRNDRPDGGLYRSRDLRAASEPAFNLTEKTRSWVRFRQNARSNGTVRDLDEPAPTITGGHDHNERVWEIEPPAAYNARDQRDGRTGKPNRMRGADEPAPTISGESRNDSWVFERPATVVCADPRVFPPGHFHRNDQGDNRTGAGPNGQPIRVSIEEAAVLQSFPADYPFQGTKTKQFQQVGNAVPPLFAEAVLRAVLS